MAELEGPIEKDAADGVFEGGGVKGIAFVGALEAARERGIERWVNVAGTSAGAIIASLLAVGYEPGQLRSILEHVNRFCPRSDASKAPLMPSKFNGGVQ